MPLKVQVNVSRLTAICARCFALYETFSCSLVRQWSKMNGLNVVFWRCDPSISIFPAPFSSTRSRLGLSLMKHRAARS
jgi:hypothetical protein